MSLLDEIKPTKKLRVMDLAHEAGLDVSDWSNYENGETNPGANPKYCYEWAFVESGKMVVLNLWFDNMREVNGQLEHTLYFSESAWHESNPTRTARRNRLIEAVNTAFHEKLPVRVIVVDGRHQKDPTPDKPNRVKTRRLDRIPWSVVSFDTTSGEVLFRRGFTAAPLSPYVDQFSLRTEPLGATGKHEVHGTAFNRSSAVRQVVLTRAKGKCEYCHQQGFTLPGGSIYLETHHVKPLSESGDDGTSNVVALCPNHHREAHFGGNMQEISNILLRYLCEIKG